MLSYKLYFSVLTGESRCRVKNNGTWREPPFVKEILDSYLKQRNTFAMPNRFYYIMFIIHKYVSLENNHTIR